MLNKAVNVICDNVHKIYQYQIQTHEIPLLIAYWTIQIKSKIYKFIVIINILKFT